MFPFPCLGKTRYHYVTPDGGPPNEGKVPTGSALDPPNPFQAVLNPFMTSNCVPGAVHPFGVSNPMPDPVCYWNTPSGAPCWPTTSFVPPPPPPPYYAPAAPTYGIPVPPPPAPSSSSGEFYSTGERVPPLSGNRVKGQLPRFENGINYLFESDNCTLHVFDENVISKYGASPFGGEVKISNDAFTTQVVPCTMTFENVIRKLDCQTRANHHPPYNRPGNEYPVHQIGIQELIPKGGGTYIIGSRIMLGTPKAGEAIGSMWPDSVGSAGQERPRYIVRCPV